MSSTNRELEEEYQIYNIQLSNELKDIPMTERQRNNIQHDIDMLEVVFRKATQ